MEKKISSFGNYLILFAAWYCFSPLQGETGHRPKNIILLIGDGMGTTQIYAALSVNGGHLNMERCTHTGFSKTSSATDYITDSGAGGTAIATGQKTRNNTIGIDTLGRPLKTLLEIAEEQGKATGLIATSSIVHATPASFIAHNNDRNDYYGIAADFLKTDIDLFIGGGLKFFRQRPDQRNLIDELKAKQYHVIYSLAEADSVLQGKLACLTADEHNPPCLKGRGEYLSGALKTGLRLLSQNSSGFFIMAEGSQIDWGGHENNAQYMISETIDFDKAAGIAIDFAEKDSNTLVIITADHETGGLSITGGDLKKHTIETHFSTRDHTPVMVPVLAFGPGSELFTGIFENTDLFRKCLLLLK